MSLNISKLKKVHTKGNKTIAQCPACRENEHDKRGEHLVINENGSFGCVLYLGKLPEAIAHRKRIFALAGDWEIKELSVAVQQRNLGTEVKTLKTALLKTILGTHGTGVKKSRAKFLPVSFSSNSKNETGDLLKSDSFLPVPCVPSELTLAEILEVFPSAQIIQEPGAHPFKNCKICGKQFVANHYPERVLCSYGCAAEDVRRNVSDNPSKTRRKYLHQQARAIWQREPEEVEPDTNNFEEWLYHFEKHIERMRELSK
jgi:hypothetical protein